jgi:protease I
MVKQKVRYTRRGGVEKAEAYIWYVEHFATRRNVVDRTFCDAIKFPISKSRRSTMATIAAILTDMFEDVEYTKPVSSFRENGHTVINVGLKAGVTVKGKSDRTPVHIDRAVSEVKVEEFDALFIPGGYSPDKLRTDERAVELAREFMASDKLVLSICHGPQLLITADVLHGRKLTGYKSIMQDIKNAGAELLDQEVVVDGNLVSSRNPGDIPAFIETSLKKLEEVKVTA